MQRPWLAVLIPVFNEQLGLKRSLEWLRHETTGFDAIVVDDGSAPSISVPEELPYPVTLIRLPGNQGIAAALNAGLERIMREGFDYVGRLDAGDVSLPGRFAAQIAFLDRHPDHALVGTQAEVTDADGELLYVFRPPTDHDNLMRQLHYRNPVCHPSDMIRTASLRSAGTYTSDYFGGEDYELWLRLARRPQARQSRPCSPAQGENAVIHHSTSASGRAQPVADPAGSFRTLVDPRPSGNSSEPAVDVSEPRCHRLDPTPAGALVGAFGLAEANDAANAMNFCVVQAKPRYLVRARLSDGGRVVAPHDAGSDAMDRVTEHHDFFDRASVRTGRLYRRALLKVLGPDLGHTIYSRTCGFIPRVEFVKVTEEDCLFRYETRHESLWFPDARIPVKLFMMSMGYRKWLREKYRCAGFVEVEAGDTVVDCGGFAGGFALSVADTAKIVHVVEPSPRNFAALARNIADLPNVHAHNIGLFDRDAVLTLNLSSTCVDDSFLSPDQGATGKTVEVRVRRVDEWASELGLERIDFMKVEAEGVENEIVRSIGDFPVDKMAVDCSPERDGLSNLDEIAADLEDKGFVVRVRRWMLFARPKEARR